MSDSNKTAQARCAVLSGATGGIGRATAQALATAGWQLVLTDVAAEGLTALASELRPHTHCVTVASDVTASDLGARLADAVQGLGVPLRGLVNLAGVIDGNSLETLSDERWQRVFDINVTSQFRLTRALLPQLRQAGAASVVNMSSILGVCAGTSMPAYCMTKAAIIGLSRSMAMDFAADGIRVNALCPGGIDTPMPRSLLTQLGVPAEQHAAVIDSVLTKQLIKRLGQPHEVADVIAFLLSDQASFMTGMALPVDGGWSAW